MVKKNEAPQGAAGTSLVTGDEAKALAAQNADMFSAHAGAGMETVTAKDILIPRLAILQGLSPQLVPNKPEYNEEAKLGQIYDIGLGEIIGKEMLFLPIAYRKEWLEWAPRATGGGLVRIHPSPDILADCKPNEKGKGAYLPNGNLIAETAQFYGLNMNKAGRLSFLPMASTQLKKARQWLTMSTSEKLLNSAGVEFTPPLFYRAYVLTTIGETNNEGDWVGWKIDRGPTLPEIEGGMKLYDKLLEYSSQISAGAMRGDTSGMTEGSTVDNSASADDSKSM